MGTGVLSHEVKRPGRPSSTEVKNKWSYSSTPTYAFMVWTGTALRVISYTSVKGFIAVWLNTPVCLFVCLVFFLILCHVIVQSVPDIWNAQCPRTSGPLTISICSVLVTDCPVTECLIPTARPVFFALLQVFRVAYTRIHFDIFTY
jgi:hypothetical protein